VPTSEHGRAVERVKRLCDVYVDARTLRMALIEEIRHAVPFDAYAWLLTDPETEVGCAPLADVPWLRELPRQIRLKYLTRLNRWTQMEAPVARLRAVTSDNRERSLVWDQLLAGYGVDDVASLVFRDRFGCWAFLELWRMEPGAGFTDAEKEFMQGIAGIVTEGLRRCQARAFDDAPSAKDRTGPVVLMLSPDLDVRAQTPETEQYLRVLVPPDADRHPIPADAYNVAAQLLAVESGVDDHRPMTRVHLASGTWLTLRAARIGDTAPTEERDIAVTIESASGAERLALFACACGLSSREGELLGHLAAGHDTRHTAQLMFVSEHTVQDHLKSIFDKTGVRNRRTLLSRVIGQ